MEELSLHSCSWWAAKRAVPGQCESGDAYVVEESPAGVLLAAVDGLGHGSEAAAATRIAVGVLRRRANDPMVDLVSQCHVALRSSRGVVMSLARYNAPEASLIWLGVGNVEGLLIRGSTGHGRSTVRLLRQTGVVGANLPPLRASTIPVSAGDTLVLATDGIARGFETDLAAQAPVEALAEWIVERHARSDDDALVLIARFAGRGT